ncbi:hypothetical protein HMPREF9371_0036 [Neisseria shayeganii 871]|uniref:Uncharacterized protein n=1 Tax=Neisseria shayeganii 871 TaxID=1032488 RepID=G4CEJ7_9NEIS|nr:hypothetical protein HMPREF9371_0036 [Neisseria shayeganii 871]
MPCGKISAAEARRKPICFACLKKFLPAYSIYPPRGYLKSAPRPF